MNNHAGKKSLKVCDTTFASGEDGATKTRFTRLSKTRRRRQNIPNKDSEISKCRKCCDVISERWEMHYCIVLKTFSICKKICLLLGLLFFWTNLDIAILPLILRMCFSSGLCIPVIYQKKKKKN